VFAVDKKHVLFYELTGVVFIIVFGSILHFTFEWSSGQAVVGVFSAVNESVWEHLKLGFWPALMFALVEFKYLKKSTSNFLMAKTIGIVLIPITIVVIFYSYTAILGESILVIDILSFVIAWAACKL
jgi:succinate dehydrogenase hydrophobic anchor subunit